MNLLILEAASIICASAAFALAYIGKPGWGWFLFVAILTSVSTYKKGK